MGKKKKFDLEKLLSNGYLSVGQVVYFVSNESSTAEIMKCTNGMHKFNVSGTFYTPHALVVNWLATEPTNHATQWIRVESGQTLYEVWDDFLNGVESTEKAA